MEDLGGVGGIDYKVCSASISFGKVPRAYSFASAFVSILPNYRIC